MHARHKEDSRAIKRFPSYILTWRVESHHRAMLRPAPSDSIPAPEEREVDERIRALCKEGLNLPEGEGVKGVKEFPKTGRREPCALGKDKR